MNRYKFCSGKHLGDREMSTAIAGALTSVIGMAGTATSILSSFFDKLVKIARTILRAMERGFAYVGRFLLERFKELLRAFRYLTTTIVRVASRDIEASIALMVFFREVLFG